MENLPQLAPLAILFPSVGAIINYFWGAKLNERWSSLIAQVAAILSFIVSFVLFGYLGGTHAQAVVVNPPFLDGWLRIGSINMEIPWQIRVDTLSVTMMLVVTGVGSLIHIYAGGYMHGDPKFSRFFGFLNMFLVFMLVLVMGNNFLMMFVGWEGVGLCSYLLIGFWWDKAAPEGWKNANAGRKAFIVNRIGDLGVLMAIFLIFITFGTLDFYKPGEVQNVPLVSGEVHGAEDEQSEAGDAEQALSEAASQRPVLGGESTDAAHTETATDEHGDEASTDADDGHNTTAAAYTDNTHITDTLGVGSLGVFNQAEAFLALSSGGEDVEAAEADSHAEATSDSETLIYSYDSSGNPVERGRTVNIAPFGDVDIEVIITLITLFMLLGAAGKSAQFPLFVWLPDAMAGPTPVSALIHAATMVTAGVYMMVRSNVLFSAAELTTFIVTIVGVSTALMAGFIAMGQWDIKRVLAYSTVSQLGFMVAAVGLGGYVAAMFHLVTHAVFKALLFLGSGSVIHGMEHGHHHAHEHGHGHGDDHHDEPFDPQDMRYMGGMRKKMPITYWTYIIGTLALSGIPIFAGFWSKDEILADALYVAINEGLFKGFFALIGLAIAAGFTAFYMWRQIALVFHGDPRSEAAEHAPESAPSMVIPLMILAFFAVIIGFINVPGGTPLYTGNLHAFGHFLEYSLVSVTRGHTLDFNIGLATIATLIGLGAIILAGRKYGNNKGIVEGDRDALQGQLGPIWTLANGRLYLDEIYYRFIEGPFNRLAGFIANVLDWNFLHDYLHDSVIHRGFDAIGQFLSKPFDIGIIDGVVNGVGWLVKMFSGQLRQVQTGYVRTYAVALLLGVVAVIIIMLLPLLQTG